MIQFVAAIAAALILIGLILRGQGRETRREHGLTDAPTLDLDTRTFYSTRLGLAGRPDRLFREGAATIPEEWKSARRIYDSHKAQLGTYFVLIEEETRIRPAYGVIVLGDGSRVEVPNTQALRAKVLAVAIEIRVARRELGVEIAVNQSPSKCRACGMREGCGQCSA